MKDNKKFRSIHDFHEVLRTGNNLPNSLSFIYNETRLKEIKQHDNVFFYFTFFLLIFFN